MASRGALRHAMRENLVSAILGKDKGKTAIRCSLWAFVTLPALRKTLMHLREQG